MGSRVHRHRQRAESCLGIALVKQQASVGISQSWVRREIQEGVLENLVGFFWMAELNQDASIKESDARLESSVLFGWVLLSCPAFAKAAAVAQARSLAGQFVRLAQVGLGLGDGVIRQVGLRQGQVDGRVVRDGVRSGAEGFGGFGGLAAALVSAG